MIDIETRKEFLKFLIYNLESAIKQTESSDGFHYALILEKIPKKITKRASEDELAKYFKDNSLHELKKVQQALRDTIDEEYKEKNTHIQLLIVIVLAVTAIAAIITTGINFSVGSNQIKLTWPHISTVIYSGGYFAAASNFDACPYQLDVYYGKYNKPVSIIEATNYGKYAAYVQFRNRSYGVSTDTDNGWFSLASEKNITRSIFLNLTESTQNFNFNFWVECQGVDELTCDFWAACGVYCEYNRTPSSTHPPSWELVSKTLMEDVNGICQA